MTRLLCKIGSIGFVGKKRGVEAGDIFEAPLVLAETLIKQGYAEKAELKKAEPAKYPPKKERREKAD